MAEKRDQSSLLPGKPLHPVPRAIRSRVSRLAARGRVGGIIAAGGVLASGGEGRTPPAERGLTPLNVGPAYFALRAGVPLVPLAINGTSWLKLGRRVRIQVGEPLATGGRPTS